MAHRLGLLIAVTNPASKVNSPNSIGRVLGTDFESGSDGGVFSSSRKLCVCVWHGSPAAGQAEPLPAPPPSKFSPSFPKLFLLKEESPLPAPGTFGIFLNGSVNTMGRG